MEHEPDPAGAVSGIRNTQLRFRVLPIAYGLGVLALAMFFTLTGNNFSVFILLPLAVMFWFDFVRPFHRRRYRRAIAELPSGSSAPSDPGRAGPARWTQRPNAVKAACTYLFDRFPEEGGVARDRSTTSCSSPSRSARRH